MRSDAVVQCSKCDGDRVILDASGELSVCDECLGEGKVAAPAFRVPLRPQPGTKRAIERRYGGAR